MICAIYVVVLIVAAIVIWRRKSPRVSRYFKWAVLASVVVWFLVFLLVVPFYCIHDRLTCRSNMGKILIALWEYSKDHDGEYPAKLEELHPDHIDLTTVRCPMREDDGSPLATGYHYLQGATYDPHVQEPVLFCENYHIDGHSIAFNFPLIQLSINRYSAGFGIETSDLQFHWVYAGLEKYNGPARRRYLAFRLYPYDGSRPTLELVQSLKGRLDEHPLVVPEETEE